MKRAICIFLLLLGIAVISMAGDTAPTRFIKIHFLYGSQPAKGQSGKETKWFGGFHGRHASIEVNDEVIGFITRGKLHILANTITSIAVLSVKPVTMGEGQCHLEVHIDPDTCK